MAPMGVLHLLCLAWTTLLIPPSLAQTSASASPSASASAPASASSHVHPLAHLSAHAHDSHALHPSTDSHALSRLHAALLPLVHAAREEVLRLSTAWAQAQSTIPQGAPGTVQRVFRDCDSEVQSALGRLEQAERVLEDGEGDEFEDGMDVAVWLAAAGRHVRSCRSFVRDVQGQKQRQRLRQGEAQQADSLALQLDSSAIHRILHQGLSQHAAMVQRRNLLVVRKPSTTQPQATVAAQAQAQALPLTNVRGQALATAHTQALPHPQALPHTLTLAQAQAQAQARARAWAQAQAQAQVQAQAQAQVEGMHLLHLAGAAAASEGYSKGSKSKARGAIVRWTPHIDATVAKDGSGDYKTVKAALDAVGSMPVMPRTILIKAGVYQEYLTITIPYLRLVGDDANTTVITGSRSAALTGDTGYASATMVVKADAFVAINLAFENSAGPLGHQAIALRVDSDRAAFYKCRFLGYQDTLLANVGRQYYKDCIVEGTVDFVYGDPQAVFDYCEFRFRRPKGKNIMVAASGRDSPNSPTGIVLINSRFILAHDNPAPLRRRTFGRPWQDYARVVVMHSYIGDNAIGPLRWMAWGNETKNPYYGEYMNWGPTADTSQRVPWAKPGVLSDSDAKQFYPDAFINAAKWVRKTGIPY